MSILSQKNKIYPVACHTDNVGPGTKFIAIKGYSFDGADYIPLAIEKGATKIVVESGTICDCGDIPVVYVDNTRKSLAQLSAQAWGFPAKKLKIIGITGTKGKTTTTFLLEHILRETGFSTALLSTVKNCINGVDYKASLTTAQPDYLHMFFDACVKEGVEWVVMEVAAQAFTLNRVDGIEFDYGVFTNFSQEHGEFYESMDDYFAAKKELINHLKPDASLFLNKDDSSVAQLASNNQSSCFFGKDHAYQCPALIGEFNAYNSGAAVVVAQSIGISSFAIQKALTVFSHVPGRMETYDLPNGAKGIIDYAHNPSSYEAVLSALRMKTDNLIIVFGCAGDRDATRRPQMGRIVSKYADYAVLTSDNPRSEDPQVIADEVLVGVADNYRSKFIVDLDRQRAIEKAYKISSDGSYIVVLGKGPDEYQIIGKKKYPFSDKMYLLECI